MQPSLIHRLELGKTFRPDKPLSPFCLWLSPFLRSPTSLASFVFFFLHCSALTSEISWSYGVRDFNIAKNFEENMSFKAADFLASSSVAPVLMNEMTLTWSRSARTDRGSLHIYQLGSKSWPVSLTLTSSTFLPVFRLWVFGEEDLLLISQVTGQLFFFFSAYELPKMVLPLPPHLLPFLLATVDFFLLVLTV